MTDLQLSRCSVEAARHCSEKDQHFQHLETSFCQSGESTLHYSTHAQKFKYSTPNKLIIQNYYYQPIHMYFRDFGNSADKHLLLKGVPKVRLHFVFVIFLGSRAHTEELLIAIG